MARLEFGLSEFLFGSCSALCGIKHGIPGLAPAETYSSKGAEVRLSKTEQCPRKKPAPVRTISWQGLSRPAAPVFYDQGCSEESNLQEQNTARRIGGMPRPLVPCYPQPRQPRSAHLAGFSLSGASPPWLEARQRLPRRPLSYMFRTWCSGSGNRELGCPRHAARPCYSVRTYNLESDRSL
jgi:hypothetical protein